MAYTDIFSGQLIFPSQLSYLSITTAVDITLSWPTEQQIGGSNVVADFIDVETTVASLNIDMPAATATGTGNKATFNNVGAQTFTVRDSGGATIQSVAPGEQWVIVLRDNTTTAGLWRSFQLGATVAASNAAALAGAGLKAITTTLNQKIDSTVEAATPFTVVDGDRANCLIYTAGAGTANLPSPGTVGNDWFFLLRNSGSGTLNVVPPSGTIDGASSINLEPNDSAFIFTDGTNFFTVGLSSGSTIAFDFVSIAVPGSGDFTLSGANLNRIAYRFTGALTGNRNIIVPNTTQQYWIDNSTTGAFTLTVKTAAGAGISIAQGQTGIGYSDGTDVVNAVSSTSVTFPITVGQGGTGATDAATALSNLGGVATSRAINTTAPVTGGGDLTADRTIAVGAASESATGVAEIATQAETDAGTDDTRFITPLKLENKVIVTANNVFKRKQVQTTRSNDATLSDDPHLAGWSLDANQNYWVEGMLAVNQQAGGLTPGLRIGWAYSGSFATLSQIGYIHQDSSSATIMSDVTTGVAVFDMVVSSSRLWIRGIFRTNTTGTLDFQWAQANSSANFAGLDGGSWINIINTNLGSTGTSAQFVS